MKTDIDERRFFQVLPNNIRKVSNFFTLSAHFLLGMIFAIFITKCITILNLRDMILSTTPQIEGYSIREYKGVVTGETIIGANFLKDLMAGIRDIVGGRSASYEKVLRQAKDTAMQEMMERAMQMGANAIVGIDIDYETIGKDNSMLMVATSGTAVVI